MKPSLLLFALLSPCMAGTIDWQFLNPVEPISSGEIFYYDSYGITPMEAATFDLGIVQVQSWTQGLPFFTFRNLGPGPAPTFDMIEMTGSDLWVADGLVAGDNYLLTIDNSAAGQSLDFQLNENVFGFDPADPSPWGPTPQPVPEPGYAWLVFMLVGVAILGSLVKRSRRG